MCPACSHEDMYVIWVQRMHLTSKGSSKARAGDAWHALYLYVYIMGNEHADASVYGHAVQFWKSSLCMCES